MNLKRLVLAIEIASSYRLFDFRAGSIAQTAVVDHEWVKQPEFTGIFESFDDLSTSEDFFPASEEPVDVVFTWIAEPSEAEYEEIKKICKTEEGADVRRFRDTGTFPYALQAAVTFLPFARNFYVVTAGGDADTPCWIHEAVEALRKKNETSVAPPKVAAGDSEFTAIEQKEGPTGLDFVAQFYDTGRLKFISHQQIWGPNAERELPSYNSWAITSHLHRIPDLAEKFIYFADDFLVSKTLGKMSFFHQEKDGGHPLVPTSKQYLTKVKKWWEVLERKGMDEEHNDIKLPRGMMFEHAWRASTKSLIAKIQSKFPSTFREISAMRCRFDQKSKIRYDHDNDCMDGSDDCESYNTPDNNKVEKNAPLMGEEYNVVKNHKMKDHAMSENIRNSRPEIVENGIAEDAVTQDDDNVQKNDDAVENQNDVVEDGEVMLAEHFSKAKSTSNIKATDINMEPFYIYQWYGTLFKYYDMTISEVPWLNDQIIQGGDQSIHNFYSEIHTTRPQFFIVNDDFAREGDKAKKQIAEEKEFLKTFYEENPGPQIQDVEEMC